MKRCVLLIGLLLLTGRIAAMDDWAIAVHGGAGAFDPARLPQERRQRVLAGLDRALAAGRDVLAAGGEALDAVQAAVQVLEDDPAFNAGRGAVFTSAGTHELDAAIMDGRDRRAGAVAAVSRVRNPVLLARQVMERTPHVLLIGAGAEALAGEAGLALVEPAWFDTEAARLQLEAWRSRQPAAEKHGTVGAVARDRAGHLAAATSTGGTTGKRPGRVGDSPLIGAGTWADDASCAVSCTGIGEFFIRRAAAHAIADRVALLGEPVQTAADDVLLRQLGPEGGEGGAIVLGRHGTPAIASNVSGMFHAWQVAGGSANAALAPALRAQPMP